MALVQGIFISKIYRQKNAKVTLYHELQHVVQDIEGFGFKNRVSSDENFDSYFKQHGEAETRNVETRLDSLNKRQ